jgi:DNA repair photolyase
MLTPTAILKPGAYASPRWTGEIADCSMPITFDQYGKCGFGCIYCFARFQKSIGVAKQNYESDYVTSVNVDRVKAIFDLKRKCQFTPLIAERKVIQWGGMGDPFCNYERQFGVGLQLLQYFASIDYPICFSTKGTWWTEDKRYMQYFQGRSNWNVKFSIITLDAELQKLVEPRVPSSAARLRAMERLAKISNGGVTLRLRPFIIGVSNKNNGHVELIKRAAESGATAVSTEFFCVEGRCTSLQQDLAVISQKIGWNIFAFYKKYSYATGYYRLNREIKRPYVDQMQEACDKYGLRFYVSDAHFKERCANGSCCGLPADWNYCKGQWTEALQIAKTKGKVTWSDIKDHLAYATKFLYRKANGFNTGSCERRAKFYTHSMYDYLLHVWNNPKNGQNPYTMYEGILTPSTKKDKDGNLIYVYDKSKE